ncbi:Tn3 family transposase [Crocosphaera sp.]
MNKLTYRALAELGKVIKTIFLCKYLQDESHIYLIVL